MRVVHFDCFSGISGDMLLGAALDAGAPQEVLQQVLDSLNLPIRLEVERVKRCGFAATKVTIHAQDEENYRFLPDIQAIVDKAHLTAAQRERVLAVFQRLAVAEAESHGMPIERVHFHEVGALDSIADIVGAVVLLDSFQATRFTSSSVPTGTGTVKGAHGVMPVPAPGTAALLKGVPLAKSTVKGELTTPTGAAILTTYSHEWTDAPEMTIERVGTGAGTKDFIEQPNILRLFVGETAQAKGTGSGVTDHVWVLETNLDDCSGEVIGYTIERLFAAGARDVFTVPIQMKKQRPGVLLSVLAEDATRETLEAILLMETGSFGVRCCRMERSTLHRETQEIQTPWGMVRIKRGWREGLELCTPEYEDCARVAREHGLPLREVYKAIRQLTATRVVPAD